MVLSTFRVLEPIHCIEKQLKNTLHQVISFIIIVPVFWSTVEQLLPELLATLKICIHNFNELFQRNSLLIEDMVF